MENIKKYLPWTIRIIISFLFLLSAVAKLYPSPYFAISTFEVKQLYPLGFSEDFAPFFSRILIGIELALGLLLLQSNYLRRIVIPATIAMLVIFTIHLSIETFVNGGNSGNCGCFGSLLPMTPIEAIVKNVVAIILSTYLLKILGNTRKKKSNFWILTTVTFAAILSLFMLAPIQPKTDFSVSEEPVNEILEDTITINPDVSSSTSKIDTVKKIDDSKKAEAIVVNEPPKHKSGYASYFSNIDKGRKTLCFFVPGCDHCREVAKELTEMKKNDKNFPEISIIFMNEEAFLIPEFFKFAGAEYPYKIIEVIPFWKLLGTNKDTPGVKYLWNGNEYVYYYGITDNKFDAAKFKALVNKPYSELKK
jgi:hypothetical protein